MDTVEVRTRAHFQAFEVPEFALMVSDPESDSGVRVRIEDLEPQVLDALAKRWLDNLFASAQRRSPFEMAA